MKVQYYTQHLNRDEAAALARSPSNIRTYIRTTTLEPMTARTKLPIGAGQSRVLIAEDRDTLITWLDSVGEPIFTRIPEPYNERVRFSCCIREYRNLAQTALTASQKVVRAIPQAVVHAPATELRALKTTISSAAHMPASDRFKRLREHHIGYLDTMHTYSASFDSVKKMGLRDLCAFMIVTMNGPTQNNWVPGHIPTSSPAFALQLDQRRPAMGAHRS